MAITIKRSVGDVGVLLVKTPALPVAVSNPFSEAMQSSAGPEHIDPNGDYTILVALSDFAAKKFPKKTLRLMHRTMPSTVYKVKEFDPSSGRAKLEGGFKGGVLKPVITEREIDFYFPQWASA